MRVGVLADTHMPRFGRSLPRALRAGLVESGVELIVHLGDFTATFVPGLLEAIAPLEAVAGNNDPPELLRRFGRRRVLEVEDVRIGLTHGDEGLGRTTPQRARNAFDTGVDAIFFGHSHIPLLERHDGLLLLNPGSPTDKRRQALYSYAIVEIEGGEISARLVTYADRAAE